MKTKIKQVTAATFIALLLMAVGIKADASATKLTNANKAETTLQVEDRMIDETIWNASEMSFFTYETDAALKVEDWMTNHRIWHTHSHFNFEPKIALEVENWMTDKATWAITETMAEEKLTVENWMLDSKIWE